MEEVIQQPTAPRKKAMVKAFVLVAFVLGAIALVRLTPVKAYLMAEALGRFLEAVGFWASGNRGELVSFKVFFSLGLFAFSFFIPKIIKKVKGED